MYRFANGIDIGVPVSQGGGQTVGQVAFPSTQNASTGVNTLDHYEEGTWTPTDASGAGLSFATARGTFVKVGKIVHVYCEVTYPATASGATATLGSLPFTHENVQPRGSLAKGYAAGVAPTSALFNVNATTITLYNGASLATNANCSGANFFFGGSYAATS